MPLEAELRHDDFSLLRRYALTRDEEAFRRLAARHIDFVFSLCRRQNLSVELAQDVTQDVMLCLATKSRQVRPDASLSSWLFAVTINKCRETKRKEARRAKTEKLALQPEPQKEADIDWAIASLPESDRTVLVMRYVQECTNQEVADALGTTEDAVRMRANRALALLRKRLGYGVIIPGLKLEPCPISGSQLILPVRKTVAFRPIAKVAGILAGTGATLALSGSAITNMSHAATSSEAGVSLGTQLVRNWSSNEEMGKSLLPISGHVQVLEGGKVLYEGDTWRTKDVARWRSTMFGQQVEAERKGDRVRSIANNGQTIPDNVANIVIGSKDRRVVETDLFEAALVTLPIYIHRDPALATADIDGYVPKDDGKLKKVTMTADGGRKYQVWLDPAHDGRICKVDYTVGDFRFVTTADKWKTLTNGAQLPDVLSIESQFKGKKSSSRQVRISDVKVGDGVTPPPMPSPKKNSRVIDEIRHTYYLIDENWRRVSTEIPTERANLGGG